MIRINLFLFLLITGTVYAQTDSETEEGASRLTLTLDNMQGGYHANTAVIFKDRVSGATFAGNTDGKGILQISLPAPASYEVKMGNNPLPKILKIPVAGANMRLTYSYPPNLAEFDRSNLMPPEQLKKYKQKIALLPDTTRYPVAKASSSLEPTEQFAFFQMKLKNFNGHPLVGETITVSTRNYHKVFISATNQLGTAEMLLPKGDTFDISFKYDRNYKIDYLPPQLGMVELEIEISYIGTVVLERLKRIEDARIAEEKKRMEAERKELEAYAKKKGVSLEAASAMRIKERMAEEERQRKEWAALEAKEQARRMEEDAQRSWKHYIENYEANARERAKRNQGTRFEVPLSKEEFLKWYKNPSSHYTPSPEDTLFKCVFRRNTGWTNKLIVCDLTGSMAEYQSRLSTWYSLNHAIEKNLQFVFFNDGNGIADHKKVIGATGGVYYCRSKGLDDLIGMMSKVVAAGNGGDIPENNMEALIRGIKSASAFSHLIMIADNNSSVKDMQLLASFKVPVKIILCGVEQYIHPDYLLIAKMTGGSVHTVEKDITDLARLAEGQTFTYRGITYRLMNGRFVPVSGW